MKKGIRKSTQPLLQLSLFGEIIPLQESIYNNDIELNGNLYVRTSGKFYLACDTRRYEITNDELSAQLESKWREQNLIDKI